MIPGRAVVAGLIFPASVPVTLYHVVVNNAELAFPGPKRHEFEGDWNCTAEIFVDPSKLVHYIPEVSVESIVLGEEGAWPIGRSIGSDT
jgi:hypothetical protein